MAQLVLIQAEGRRREIAVHGGELILGRQRDAGVMLEGNEVSRRHSRIVCQGDRYSIEDLGSSNGTFVNGVKIRGQTELRPFDEIRIGPHILRFEAPTDARPEGLTIFGRTEADTKNDSIFRENPTVKLRAILEVSHLLASAGDLDELFRRLLDYLLVLFPKADHGVVVLVERGELLLRGRKYRQASESQGLAFSRSVATRAIKEGQGILGENAMTDTRFKEAQTLIALGVRSFICAPLTMRGGRALGAIQLDRLGAGRPFATEDLNLITAVALQVAAAVENVQLHEQLVVKERMERELALARQIQESFLPQQIPSLPPGQVDLFARVYPALQVSGDFYDYFLDETGRLTFAVADVCGKGMPAALFTTMCLTLLRHLAPGSSSPAAILQKLNAALARDNPGMMYVTMVLGKFDPATGQVVVAYGGHPLGTRLRPDGTIEPFGGDTGALLGCGELPRPISDVTTTLAPGEALLFYTDGVTEAVGGDSGSEMFGSARFEKLIQELRYEDPLDLWARSIHASVTAFGRGRPLIDDVTLLIVRRPR